jgi:hypothetical protein
MTQHRASFSVADKRRPSQLSSQHRNIDYLSFAADPLAGYTLNHTTGIKSEVSASDWERLLGSLDSGQTNIYDNIYGGPPAEALLDAGPLSASADSTATWSPNAWSWGGSGGGASEHAVAAPPQRRGLWLHLLRLWLYPRQRQDVRRHHDPGHEHAHRPRRAGWEFRTVRLV